MFKQAGAKYKRGFTLVEILIVVVIIGILASLTLPRLTGQQEKARVAEAIGFLSAMRRGQLAYFNANSTYLFADSTSLVDTWQKLGLEKPDTTNSFWQFSALRDGSVRAVRTALLRPAGVADGSAMRLDTGGNWFGGGSYAAGAEGSHYLPTR